MKSMARWRIGVVTVLMTALMAAVAQAQQPTVVFSIRGIDPLLDDAEFIGEELGHEGSKATAEQLIAAFTGGKGLAGIDKEKPLGLYWNASAAGAPEMPVVFLPVADADELKGLLTELPVEFKDSKGQWTMSVNGTKLFAKVSTGYCFISNAPTALAKLPDPSKFANTKYDLALDVNIASIPADLKETFLTQAEASGRQRMEEGPEPKSEAERVTRDITFDAMIAGMRSLLIDGDKFTIGANVDEEARTGALDIGVTGKANSGLANAWSAYAKTAPAFAGIGSDAAPFRMVVSYPTTGFTEQLDAIFKAMRETADKAIDDDENLKSDDDRDTARNIAKRIFDIFQSTTKSGSMHSGVVLEAGGSDKIRVIGGTRVAKGDDAEKLLEELVKLAKEKPEVAKVKIDAAKHAGARIHAVTPDQSEENAKYFGDEPGHLAIRPDSVWVSIGGDNLTALKKALDAKPPVRTTTSPISIQVKPAALVLLMEKDDEDLIERAKEVASKPGDKLLFDVAPTANGAKIRIEFGIDLLQLADQLD